MIAVLFLDYSSAGAYTDISPTDPARGYEHPEIVAYLRDDPDVFRIDTRTEIADLWQPDSAALHQLDDVWGVANPLLLQHWSDLWEATGGRQTRRYDMLNVKYVLVRTGTPLPEGKFDHVLDSPAGLSLYGNVDFLPCAWLVHEVKALPPGAFDGSDFEEIFDATGMEPTTLALVEADTAPPVESNAAGEETVDVRTISNALLSVEVDAAAPALLVMSEVWYPGWRATVNGEPVDVLRANGALQAVAVPAGRSTVIMRFAPSTWHWGLVTFLVGVAGISLLLVRGSGTRPNR